MSSLTVFLSRIPDNLIAEWVRMDCLYLEYVKTDLTKAHHFLFADYQPFLKNFIDPLWPAEIMFPSYEVLYTELTLRRRDQRIAQVNNSSQP